MLFAGKKVLITGGTGSLGSALTKRLLKNKVDTIRIYSRDEWKQAQMKSEINDKRLRFLIGDVRDKSRLERAMEDIDIVFHTAALKQVPVAEYNPFEFVKTNVYGTQNVIEVCLDNKIELAIGIGTDKAVSPLNTYGATKLLMERLFISANYYKGPRKTKFICVRYGNVLGSRGSILPVFIEKISKGQKIPITDENMTRFTITMSEALDLVFRAAKNGKDGEIFIPKLMAYRVGDIKDVIMKLYGKDVGIEKIPIRPGEKFHELLISKHEIKNTYESDKDYILYNFVNEDIYEKPKIPYTKTKLKEEYSSDKVKLIPKKELERLIINEKLA